MTMLAERINDYIRRNGKTPDYIILSTLEATTLKLQLGNYISTEYSFFQLPNEYMGIKIIDGSNCLLPESI